MIEKAVYNYIKDNALAPCDNFSIGKINVYGEWVTCNILSGDGKFIKCFVVEERDIITWMYSKLEFK